MGLGCSLSQAMDRWKMGLQQTSLMGHMKIKQKMTQIHDEKDFFMIIVISWTFERNMLRNS